MLDIKTATLVKNAINKEMNGEIATLEDACRMQPISQTTYGSGYTILALQYGDLTILVWIQFSEKLGAMVRKVKTQAW